MKTVKKKENLYGTIYMDLFSYRVEQKAEGFAINVKEKIFLSAVMETAEDFSDKNNAAFAK